MSVEQSPLLAEALAKLIQESPSVRAAMKAGRKTSISMRVYREKTGRWDDYGPVATMQSEGWASWLRGKLGMSKIVYRVKGITIDETTL